MKKIIFVLIFALTTTTLASETAKGAKKDYEEFKVEMTQKLEATEKKIAELKAKAKTKGSEAEAKTIAEFEKTRDDLKQSLDELQKKSESNWKKLKKKFSSSVDNLNKKIQKKLED